MANEQRIPWYKRDISLGRAATMTDLVMLSKHFAVMLRAGLTAPETLEVLVEQRSGRLRAVLTRVNTRVRAGTTLADAMAVEPRVFGPVFLSAIRVGEQSGTMAENLEQLAEQMEKDLLLRRTISSAMLYPALVLSLAFVISLGIATFVLPQITSVFESLTIDLPWTTRTLINVADVFDRYGVWISLGAMAAVLGAIWSTRLPALRPFFDRLTLHIPVIGNLLHDVNRARFCRTVGTLLQSGVPIHEVLEISARVLPNVIYRHSVQYMLERVATGESFSQIVGMYPKLYPKVVHRMIAVGERSGSLGAVLGDVAAFYESRVENQSKGLSTLIEPLLLVFIGTIVGLIAVSILTPIYSITSNLSL